MAKPLRIAQHSWVGGMLNEDLMGRQDLAKYFQGATEITNFVVRRQGCLMKRGGTDLVESVPFASAKSRLIPFVWDKHYGGALLFTDGRVDVFPRKTFGTVYRLTRKLRFIERYCVSTSGPSTTTASNPFLNAAMIDDVQTRVISPTFTARSGVTSWDPPHHAKIVFDTKNGTARGNGKFNSTAPDVQPYTGSDDDVIDCGSSGDTWYTELTEWLPEKKIPDVTGWYAIEKTETVFYNPRIYKASTSTYDAIAERMVGFSYYTYDTNPSNSEYAERVIQDGPWMNQGFHFDRVYQTKFTSNVTIGEVTRKYDYGLLSIWEPALVESSVAEQRETTFDSPYSEDDLLELRYCQSGDVLFLVHPRYPVHQFRRESDGRFVIEPLTLNNALPKGPTKVSGVCTPVASSAGARTLYYAVTQVIDGVESLPTKTAGIEVKNFPWGSGGYVMLTITGRNANATELRIYRDEGFGMGLIRIVDPASSVKDIYVSADYSQEPPRNPDSIFDGAGSFPSCVSIYQQRMILANTLRNPNRYWMSNVGDLYTFSTKRTITEDDAIIASLPLLKGPKILHLVTGKDLLAFTESCEVLIKPSAGNSLSYKTVSAEIQSYTGCNARLPPIVCEAAVLFADRAGQSVREFKYNYAMDTMQGLDVSVLSSSLFADKQIVDWCYQQFPDSNLLCVLSDGTLAVMTYMPDQEVYAWSRFEIDGFHVYACCCSEALVKHDSDTDSNALPSTSETFLFGYDAPTDRWLLLRMRPYARDNATPDAARCLDLVEDGTGRPIVSRLVTVYLDVQDGGVVERDKRVTAVTLRLKGGEGLTVRQAGVEDDGLDHTAPEAVNGLTTMTPQSDWSNCDGRVVIEHAGTDGCMIMSLTTALEVH